MRTVNSPPPRTGAKAVATKPQRQSSFRSGATSPCREFSYAEFPMRQSSFGKWRHSLIGNFPTENFGIGNFPIGTFLFLAPLL